MSAESFDLATFAFLLLRRYGLYVDMMTLNALAKAGTLTFELDSDGNDLLMITRFSIALPVINDVYSPRDYNNDRG